MSAVPDGLPDGDQGVQQCYDEIGRLAAAWADRGLGPLAIGVLFSGAGHMLLMQSGFSLALLTKMLRTRWARGGGQP